jgi:two-component SAPR family response regulator
MKTALRRNWFVTIPDEIVRASGATGGAEFEISFEDSEIRLRVLRAGESTPPEEVKAPFEAAHDEPVEAGRDLKIGCFGRLTLTDGGRVVTLTKRKARELIAYLLCHRGQPVRKTKIAQELWSDSAAENALSLLYKTCRYIRESEENIPLVEKRGFLWLDLTGVSCDILEFDRLFAEKDNIESCALAVELAKAQLFFDEAYDWVAPFEAYYDIRYLELAEKLIVHYEEEGNMARADYYRNLL